jgi:hypothetical protein
VTTPTLAAAARALLDALEDEAVTNSILEAEYALKATLAAPTPTEGER